MLGSHLNVFSRHFLVCDVKLNPTDRLKPLEILLSGNNELNPILLASVSSASASVYCVPGSGLGIPRRVTEK